MAGPGLSVTNDTTYADSSTDPSVKIHQQDHDKIATVANVSDLANAGTAGYVPIGNGTVLVTRALLSTDIPGVVINTQTSSYTLVLSDAGQLVQMNVATANNLTIPLNSSVAFQVGTEIPVVQYGAGTTTIAVISGVTLRSRGSLVTTAGPYARAALTKLATNEWLLAGDLA
jgi:hypothetical protein